MATPSAISAQDKREQIRAAYHRRTVAANETMKAAVTAAENIRAEATLQINATYSRAVEQAEAEYEEELAAAIRERTALMTKLLKES